MWSEDIAALLDRARAGDEPARSELIQAVQKDLQVVVAIYALDQAMVDAVFAAAWSDGRRTLLEAIAPAAGAQAGLWMGRVAGEPGSALAKRIRDLALVHLRQGLAAADQQAVEAQDTLLHLIAQAGLEALPEDSASIPPMPHLLRTRLRTMPPAAQGLLVKRYGERQSLVQLATAQQRDPVELAAALAMARSAVDWQSGGAMLFDPGDHAFPIQLEEFIAGVIPADMRLRLAESLLSDIGRTAGFIRQVRLDLVLTAYLQDPRAPERPLVSEPARTRTSTRLPMPPGGIPSPSELHRLQHGGGRAAMPADRGIARLALIAGGMVLVLALIMGGAALFAKSSHPAHLQDAGPAAGIIGSAHPAAAPVGMDKSSESASPGRPPAPPSGGSALARVEAGQVTALRAGGRTLLKAGAELAGGEAMETADGPVTLTLGAGRSVTIGVNSRLRGIHLDADGAAVVQLESGQLRIDSGAGALAVAYGRTLLLGQAAAFTVTTGDGLRLEVAQGTVSVQRSGLPAVMVSDHRVALIPDAGAIVQESSGTFVAAIKLGGAGGEHEGRRWTSQLQAQHDGMILARGTAAPANGLSAVDPALRSLLDPALGGEVQLALPLPAGPYDVVAWVVGPPGSGAGELRLGDHAADADAPAIGPHGWVRLPPVRGQAAKGVLAIAYAGRAQQQLAGVELYAIAAARGSLPATVVLTAPAGDLSLTAPATLALAAEAYAPLGAIRAVEFLVDGVTLGAADSAPYTLPWTIASPGAHRLSARALTDSGLSAITLPITVTITAKPPATLLLAAAEAEEGAAPAGSAGLVLSATPDHLDGAVERVEFLSDGVRIGDAVAVPYRIRWSKAAPGAHLITAVARIAGGSALAAAPLTVVVQPPARPPLLAAIESPEDGSELPESAHLTIRAKAASRDGRVTRLDYFADEQKVGESTVAPFSYVWTRATPGVHRLRVVASDDHGGSVASEPVTVLVGRNIPFVFARGIHLGGEALDLDGCHWLGEAEALRSGLAVTGARVVGELPVPATAASSEPGLTALLGSARQGDGEEITLSQSLPNGIYQISLWLSEAKPGAVPTLDLEVQGVRQILAGGRMSHGAAAKYGPFTARVLNQALTLVLRAGRGAAAPRIHGLAIAVPPSGGSAPRPLVELLFDAVNGTLTPNTGTSAPLAPTATISADGPQRSPIAAPNGGSGSMDFGKAFRPAAIDVPGLAPVLRKLKSFTISAWLNNRVAEENGGGDRIVSWSHDGGDGAELVYHNDGSLQLAVNSLVDGPGAARRSSPGLISSNDSVPLDNWRFVAVTYDATQADHQVRYYIGSGLERAYLDSAVDLNRGPVGMNPAPELTIGHTYPSFRKPGADRMYRGIIDQVRLWGSANDGSGALSPEQIASVQAAANPAALFPPFDRGDAVVPAGLVLWLNAAAGVSSLGGRVGRWEDLSGKHHDVAIEWAAQRPLLVDRLSAAGAAISFASEQRLELNGVAGLDPAAFTLMAWVRQERFEANGDQRRWIVGKNGNELDAGHFSLFTANGSAHAYLNLGGDIHLLELGSPAGMMREHAWHLLAMTYDGERLALYLDGRRVGEVAARAKRGPGGGAFVVGRRPDNFSSCDGMIAEVRLYERALGDAEIQLIERSTRARYFLAAAPIASSGAPAAGSTGAAAMARAVMLWDGESAATGSGWSVPATTRIAPQDAVAYHGTHALQFHVSGSNFANCGWNWRGWLASVPADDATLHAHLLLALKVDGAAKPSSVRLVMRSPHPDDHSKSGDSEFLDLLAYCPTLLDGAWHDLAIPLKDLTSKDPGFDLHHLFELSLFLGAPGNMESDVYLDDIGYGNAR